MLLRISILIAGAAAFAVAAAAAANAALVSTTPTSCVHCKVGIYLSCLNHNDNSGVFASKCEARQLQIHGYLSIVHHTGLADSKRPRSRTINTTHC